MIDDASADARGSARATAPEDSRVLATNLTGMSEILDAVRSGATREELASIPMPATMRAAIVRRSDQQMFDGMASRDKDPRRSLRIEPGQQLGNTIGQRLFDHRIIHLPQGASPFGRLRALPGWRLQGRLRRRRVCAGRIASIAHMLLRRHTHAYPNRCVSRQHILADPIMACGDRARRPHQACCIFTSGYFSVYP